MRTLLLTLALVGIGMAQGQALFTITVKTDPGYPLNKFTIVSTEHPTDRVADAVQTGKTATYQVPAGLYLILVSPGGEATEEYDIAFLSKAVFRDEVVTVPVVPFLKVEAAGVNAFNQFMLSVGGATATCPKPVRISQLCGEFKGTWETSKDVMGKLPGVVQIKAWEQLKDGSYDGVFNIGGVRHVLFMVLETGTPYTYVLLSR